MFDKISESFNRPNSRLAGLCLTPVQPTNTMQLEIIQNAAQGQNNFCANIKHVTVRGFLDIDTLIKYKNRNELVWALE